MQLESQPLSFVRPQYCITLSFFTYMSFVVRFWGLQAIFYWFWLIHLFTKKNVLKQISIYFKAAIYQQIDKICYITWIHKYNCCLLIYYNFFCVSLCRTCQEKLPDIYTRTRRWLMCTVSSHGHLTIVRACYVSGARNTYAGYGQVLYRNNICMQAQVRTL